MIHRCQLCGHTIAPHEPIVPLRHGGRVHIACADLVAARGWRARQWRAGVHLGVLASVVAAALFSRAATPWQTLLFAVIWLGCHARLHQHWWAYFAHDLRRRYRR